MRTSKKALDHALATVSSRTTTVRTTDPVFCVTIRTAQNERTVYRAAHNAEAAVAAVKASLDRAEMRWAAVFVG